MSFAKAYSGLNDAEILELDRWIRRNTLQRFGPARSLKTELVFEIGFEGIHPSKRHKSGIAVRFPRILRSSSRISASLRPEYALAKVTNCGSSALVQRPKV